MPPRAAPAAWALAACCAPVVSEATVVINAAATSAFRKSRLSFLPASPTLLWTRSSVLDSICISLSCKSPLSVGCKEVPYEGRLLRFTQLGAVGNHRRDQFPIGVLGIIGVVLDTVQVVATGAGALQNRLACCIKVPLGFSRKVVEEIVGKHRSFLVGDLRAHRDHARNHF